MSFVRRAARQNRTMLLKTCSYYLIHICVAAMVAYAVPATRGAALTLRLRDPPGQAVAFFFHQTAWDRAARRRALAAPELAAAPL